MNYHWNWSIFLTEVPSGGATYMDWLLVGLKWTLSLSLSSWILALVAGVAVGTLRTAPSRALAGAMAAWVELFRNIPLLVQLFLWYFVLPEFLPFGLEQDFKQMDPTLQQFVAAWLCLGLYTSARVAEQTRAGIESLPPGQKAAGLALGLTLPGVYRRILLPQALRICLPPLTSEFLNIFKNSAVATTIGLLELSRQAQQLVDYTAQPYEAFIAATLLYMAINLTVMLAMHGLEHRLHLPGGNR